MRGSRGGGILSQTPRGCGNSVSDIQRDPGIYDKEKHPGMMLGEIPPVVHIVADPDDRLSKLPLLSSSHRQWWRGQTKNLSRSLYYITFRLLYAGSLCCCYYYCFTDLFVSNVEDHIWTSIFPSYASAKVSLKLGFVWHQSRRWPNQMREEKGKWTATKRKSKWDKIFL